MNAEQQAKFEALLDEAKCTTCKGHGGWRTKTEGAECLVCGGSGNRYTLALIDPNAELPNKRCLPRPDKQTEPYKIISIEVPRHWDNVAMESYLTNITQQDMRDDGWSRVVKRL